MLWVSIPWFYTTLHCYLSKMKPLCWHIGISAQSQWCYGRYGRNLESFCVWMNVVLAKIVAWLYLYAYEFSIMNMPYEMCLTIQLVHLTCSKDRIQSPTRKEGWDLFRRTSDDSSRNNPKWTIVWWDFKRPHTHSSYVTLLSDIIDAEPSSYEEVAKNKGKESTNSKKMMYRMRYWDLKGRT